ncbi:MAG: hypothetical protein J7L90_02015, partial [Dehalococcoidia bacterium]|nr:hypothetical protein [Dehalococcoidia bacterium]
MVKKSDFSPLLSLIDEMPAFSHLVQNMCDGKGEHLAVLPDAAKPYLIAALRRRMRTPVLLLSAQAEGAKRFYQHLMAWCGDDSHILHFPDLDVLPYENLAPSIGLLQERMGVLSSLADISDEAASGEQSIVVVASVPAVIRKTMSLAEFTSGRHTLSVGATAEPMKLLAEWFDMGYSRENMVEQPGEMSRRGGILDIYSPNNELPARMEFFGNTIESIRFFDPVTQRSTQFVRSLTVVPLGCGFPGSCSVGGGGEGETIMKYLPRNTTLILDEMADIETAVEEVNVRADKLRRQQEKDGEISERSAFPYLAMGELEENLKGVDKCLELARWDRGEESSSHYRYVMDFSPAPRYNGQASPFLSRVKEMSEGERRLIVVSRHAKRLSQLMEEEKFPVSFLASMEALPRPGTFTLLEGD